MAPFKDPRVSGPHLPAAGLAATRPGVWPWPSGVASSQPQWSWCCPCFPSGWRASTGSQRQLGPPGQPPRLSPRGRRRRHSSCTRGESSCELQRRPLRWTRRPTGHRWQGWGTRLLWTGEGRWPPVRRWSKASGIYHLHIPEIWD